VTAVLGGLRLVNLAMLATAITLGLAAGILISVWNAQRARTKPQQMEAETTPPTPASAESSPGPDSTPVPRRSDVLMLLSIFKRDILRAWRWLEEFSIDARVATAVAGLAAIGFLLLLKSPAIAPGPVTAAIAASLSLIAAGLAATAAHYLADIDPAQFPESLGLCRGARVTAWVLLLTAAAVLFAWGNQWTIARVLYFVILAINTAICYGLLTTRQPRGEAAKTFPLDLGVLSMLGSRPNILASILDAGERQLGIDLRSTWALTIVRRSIEPLVIGLCLAAWLSTSFTVVGMDEQGLVERLGVPVAGHVLDPGLRLHLPWPVDRVFLIPVQRVQTVQVGHEGEEKEGPEDVLWAVEHAPNEYTLLLGNGRDLITVDAAVQYRIVDPRAWRYHCQNPAVALRAIAYRAVMRSTVNLTLSQALSQNVAILTSQMRTMVQKDADTLGLGVDIIGFTVGGMHPPVSVAPAYEEVVSAQVAKVTAVVNAQADRNRQVPAAESAVVAGENTARAEGLRDLGLAAGEAWSFRALESQYRAAPAEYFFRRRLETLEKVLPSRKYTVVDSRFLRDGGEIWTTR
jgi:regulator of protease activity HflC (stomatin/prohibitin superfamily)